MNINSNLIMTQKDFEKLSSLLLLSAESSTTELLDQELNRATVVSPEELPVDAVTMNSKVSFEDLDTGKQMAVTLVYPHEANIDENKISILAPIGSALIGLRVGQVINWPVPNGKVKSLKVTSVHFQPDSAEL